MTCTLINFHTRERRELSPITEAPAAISLSSLIRPKPRAVRPYEEQYWRERRALDSIIFGPQRPCDSE